MFRSAPRLIVRHGARPALRAPARRFLSTAPPAQKSRSWKSLVARLGLAGAIIYYYNTTDVFAQDARQLAPVHALPTADSEATALPTIESIAAERAQRRAVQNHLALQQEKEAAVEMQQPQLSGDSAPEAPQEGGIEGLQAEADQQGAFNPETGEINWDCPCLGGMATGPCGDEFKAAFSCFVYSAEEPKGMDCIDKFKDMQNCFRQYPEIYGSEIDNEDDEDELTADAAEVAGGRTEARTDKSRTNEAQPNSAPPASSGPHSAEKVQQNRRELGLVPENYRPEEKHLEAPISSSNESESLLPKATHDGR